MFASSVDDAWARLADDIASFGSANNQASRVLWLDVGRGVVGVDEHIADSPFWEEAEDPAAWQDEARWIRSAWISAYQWTQVGPFYRAYSPAAVTALRAELTVLAELPLAAVAEHFLGLALAEIQRRYGELSLEPTDAAQHDGHRREGLVDVFELVYRNLRAADASLLDAQPPVTLPFLRQVAPDRWPAREIQGAGALFYLLADMHVSGL